MILLLPMHEFLKHTPNKIWVNRDSWLTWRWSSIPRSKFHTSKGYMHSDLWRGSGFDQPLPHPLAPPPPPKQNKTKQTWKPHWFLCCGPNLDSVSAFMPALQGLSQPLFIFWTPRDYGNSALFFKRFWFSSWICFSEQLWKLSCFEGETSCVFEIPDVTNLVILAPGD